MSARHTLKGNNLPVDPNTTIPAAVARAAAEADALMQQQSKPPTADDPAPTTQDTVIIGDVVDPPQPSPAPTEPATPSGNEPANYKHAYESMLGRFRAAERENKALSARIDGLQGVIESLKAAPPPPPQMTTEQVASLLTDEDRNNYGEEMIDLIGRRAQEIAQPMVSKLEAEVERLKHQLANTNTVAAATAKDRMEATLDQQLPEWRQININEEFKRWLDLPDPYSGVTRSQLANEAYQANDARRVLSFFNGFISEMAATSPAPGSVAPPAAAKPQHGPTLEDFAAPGRARTSAGHTQPPGEKPIITTTQIANFYEAKRRGAYAGKEDEANRLEAMIFEAQRERRVMSG